MILTPFQKLPKNGEDWGKLFVAKGFKKLPKVQNIAQSGHTVPSGQRSSQKPVNEPLCNVGSAKTSCQIFRSKLKKRSKGRKEKGLDSQKSSFHLKFMRMEKRKKR